MFCVNCGNPLSERDKFCSTCGTRVEVKTLDAVVNPDPVIPCADAVPEKKCKPVRKMLLTVLLPIVLAVMVAVILLLLFAGKKTVYLRTETVKQNYMNPYSTIYTYDFDENGRVINYAFKLKDSNSGEKIDGYEIFHTYDRKGRLIETEFDLYGADFAAKYEYDGNELTDIVFDDLPDGYDEDDVVLELDRNGNILFVAFGDRDANVFSWEFSYHDNGVIECFEHSNSITNTETVKEFDEKGTLRALEVEIIGVMKEVQEYDERGNMNRMEQYDGNGDQIMSMEIAYTFEKEQMTEIAFSVQLPDGAGVEIVFVAEWDGLECEAMVDDIDFSGNIDAEQRKEVEEMIDEGDLELHLELNENGKLIFGEVTAMGATILSESIEYEARKVSRSFIFDYDYNPIYLHFLGEL